MAKTPTSSSAKNLRGQVAIEGAASSAGSRRGQAAIARTSFSARHLRGQVAIEFFLYSGVFLFVLIAAFSIITLLQQSEIPAREALISHEQGETIAESLRLSVVAGKGFQHTLSIPKTLLGKPYIIEWGDADTSMFLTWNSSAGETSYVYPLPAYDYAWEGCLADRVLQSDQCGSTLFISNDGNTLSVRQD